MITLSTVKEQIAINGILIVMPEIKQAIQKRAQHGIFGYSGKKNDYFQVFNDWLKQRFSLNVKNEMLIDIPNVLIGLVIAILEFTRKHDKILIQSPVYFPFYNVIENNDRQLVTSELKLENNHYEIDFNELENKFRKNVKMMILCSPHNPVGRVWTESELAKLSSLCRKYNVLVLSDEIHADIVFNGFEHRPLSLISEYFRDNSILYYSPSKSFNLAGITNAIAVIQNEKIRAAFSKRKNDMYLRKGSIFGTIAFKTAYQNGQEWLQKLLNYLEKNYLWLQTHFKQNFPKIKPVKQEGTYLMWLDCRELGLEQDELVELFLDEAGLGLYNGSIFGECGKGFMRLNFACPRDLLKKALSNLEKV